MEEDATMTIDEQQEDENLDEKIINEEYKTWKKNAPFLYDLMLSTALDWPTLTTQWFSDKQSHPDKNFATHRLLLGTHTSKEANNYIQIAHVQLPNAAKPDVRNYDEERGEIGGYGNGAGATGKDGVGIKFSIVQKIDHPGEVNKARYMPQNPNMIATMCVDGRVMIWDKTKHTSVPTGSPNPQIELLGHKKEGFGLSWNPHQQGQLATGSEDKTVRLWDITQYSKTSKTLSPTRTYTHHSAIVSDVEFHPFHKHLLGSVSDDLTLQIVDLRKPSTSSSTLQANGHDDAVNALSFNPRCEFIVATASADKTVGIWDLRFLKEKTHALEGHRDAVTSLSWHPHETSILASASYDRRMIIWDLSKIGNEQTPEDAEDGPPEIAAEDNLIQVWKMATSIIAKDGEDLPVDEINE
ncbi:MAG: Histone acetyltransferase type B subunit 2 [Thelocarpon superellum]|nr:MAG: Histone acetyltransferase type B subunit 2 [Thelocarpon superellum]